MNLTNRAPKNNLTYFETHVGVHILLIIRFIQPARINKRTARNAIVFLRLKVADILHIILPPLAYLKPQNSAYTAYPDDCRVPCTCIKRVVE